MVLKNGSVKVMDFGIARVMSKSNTLTKEALGSVHYISRSRPRAAILTTVPISILWPLSCTK